MISAGVPVTATHYLGTIRDFVTLNAHAARGAVDQATDLLRTAFAR